MLNDRLRWLHPAIRRDLRFEYLWSGELDMQRKTIPRLYDLAPGVATLTGLSGRGVPTGSMLGGILADWALGLPPGELALPLEPMRSAPLYMRFAPKMSLAYHRALDNVQTRLSGRDLPPWP